MKVEMFYAQDVPVKCSREDTFNHCVVAPFIRQILMENILYNNQCHIEIDDSAFYVPIGNDTEVGLIRWLQGAEINVHETMNGRLDHEVTRIPFDSKKKRSIVAIKHPELEDTIRVYIKGAPEYLIPNCTSHFNSAGLKDVLSEEHRLEITQ